jgi:SAM-dependent methyltransferase
LTFLYRFPTILNDGLILREAEEVKLISSFWETKTRNDEAGERIMILAIFLFAGICFYVFLSFFWPLLTGGAGYTPTPSYKTSLAMEMAKVGPQDAFYDLGCGTGTVLAQAKKRGANVVGVEIEPLRWLICRLRVRTARVILGNMFKVPLNDATVVFLFQYPHVNKKIKEKLERELKPGTRVLSYAWEIDGWKPTKVIEDLYLYTVG